MKWLSLLGKIDGGVAAAAAGWGLYDSSHTALALAIAGVAGGIGMALNALSSFLGGGPVAPVKP